jgi:predicted nucleic acid-binding protein
VKVFLDTNVLLDVLANREPFAEDAARILSRVESEEIEGVIAAHTATTLFYLLDKELGTRRASRALADVLRLVQVAPVDEDRLLHALAMQWDDFEDAVQAACAEKAEVDFLVTRNEADFKGSSVPILRPTELLARLA